MNPEDLDGIERSIQAARRGGWPWRAPPDLVLAHVQRIRELEAAIEEFFRIAEDEGRWMDAKDRLRAALEETR